MKKYLPIIIISMICIFVLSCEQMTKVDHTKGFEVKNNTGVPISGLWVKNSSQSNWGNNKINYMPNGATQIVIVDDLSEKFDIMLRTTNSLTTGFEYARQNITITNGATVSFTNSDVVKEWFIITNNTGVSIAGVWVKANNTSDWGNNLISTTMSDGTSYTYNLTQPLSSNNKFDIMLRTTNSLATGIDYRKTNITITNGISVSVASGDYNIIGDTGPAGGIIFYDKGSESDGWRYLEAAPASSEFNAEWGAYVYDVSGTQTGIGTGKSNTQILNSKLQELGETGRASQLCVALTIGGKNDWFLPSKDELNLMYQNLHLQGLGDFGQGTNSESWKNWAYWSSSQRSNSYYHAWLQHFSDGYQNYYNDKNFTNRVRAVRAF